MEGQNIIVSVVYWTFWLIGKMIFIPLKYGFWGIVMLVRGEQAKQRSIPREFHSSYTSRFEHTLIVGGSGHGKTQLMQSLILDDLPFISQGKQSLIVIDSQGDMIRKILDLAEIAEIRERIVLIDPTDIDNPPCLNLFDFGLERAKHYDALERETLINGAIAMYEYIFGALLGAEMTNRQGVIFRYIARLLMEVPGATIYTLLDFMEDPDLVRPYLSKLDIATQRFFLTQFFSPAFDATRQQILHRLWGILSTPTLARMFSHKENRLDLFEAMNNGSLILINTAKSLLKQEGCELFGRFMIALLSQATQERAAIPEAKRLPTFVYIDEAHDYFDENLELLLNTARKYNVGVILATQNLGQFSNSLLQTVLSSTSIKYASGLSDHDRMVLSKEMNCTPESMAVLGKTNTESHFSFYDKNYKSTDGRPQAYVVVLGAMEGRPKISQENKQKLLEENRARYCAPYDPHLLMGSQAITNAGIQFELDAPKVL